MHEREKNSEKSSITNENLRIQVTGLSGSNCFLEIGKINFYYLREIF